MDLIDLGKVIIETNNRITVEDLELLQRCCDKIGAAYILEIGSADGGSSVILGAKAKERAGHLYCIEPRPRQRMVDNMNHYGLSSYYSIFAFKSPWVPDGLIPDNLDLLFIDGCHHVRWCLIDYHYWAPKVREDGIIIFHDYEGNCAEDKRCPGYGRPGYMGLVKRALDIILETDSEKLEETDRSYAHNGGAIAFRKIKD
jgi:predicted O-methyltransferase YrrM